MPSTCIPYPSDVGDDEWTFAVPFLLVLPEEASRRRYALRGALTGPHSFVRAYGRASA